MGVPISLMRRVFVLPIELQTAATALDYPCLPFTIQYCTSSDMTATAASAPQTILSRGVVQSQDRLAIEELPQELRDTIYEPVVPPDASSEVIHMHCIWQVRSFLPHVIYITTDHTQYSSHVACAMWP